MTDSTSNSNLTPLEETVLQLLAESDRSKGDILDACQLKSYSDLDPVLHKFLGKRWIETYMDECLMYRVLPAGRAQIQRPFWLQGPKK